MASKKAREEIWKSQNNHDISDVIKSWSHDSQQLKNIKAKAYELDSSNDDSNEYQDKQVGEDTEQQSDLSNDSDIDEIDVENFKGLHFEEDSVRYHCPETGCHFEYNDFCERLLKLKKFRDELDKQFGLLSSSSDPVDEKTIQKNQIKVISNQIPQQSQIPQQQRKVSNPEQKQAKEHIPFEITNQLQNQKNLTQNNHILTLQRRQIQRKCDDLSKTTNQVVGSCNFQYNIDWIKGRNIQQQIRQLKQKITGKEGRNCSLNNQQNQRQGSQGASQRTKDNNSNENMVDAKFNYQKKVMRDSLLADNQVVPQGFENPIIRQRCQEKQRILEQKKKEELQSLQKLCQQYINCSGRNTKQRMKMNKTFTEGVDPAPVAHGINIKSLILNEDSSQYLKNAPVDPALDKFFQKRDGKKSHMNNQSVQMTNVNESNATKFTIDSQEQISSYSKQRFSSIDCKANDYFTNFGVKISEQAQPQNNISRNGAQKLCINAMNTQQVTQDLLKSVQRNQQLINNIKTGSRNFSSTFNKTQANNRLNFDSKNPEQVVKATHNNYTSFQIQNQKSPNQYSPYKLQQKGQGGSNEKRTLQYTNLIMNFPQNYKKQYETTNEVTHDLQKLKKIYQNSNTLNFYHN